MITSSFPSLLPSPSNILTTYIYYQSGALSTFFFGEHNFIRLCHFCSRSGSSSPVVHFSKAVKKEGDRAHSSHGVCYGILSQPSLRTGNSTVEIMMMYLISRIRPCIHPSNHSSPIKSSKKYVEHSHPSIPFHFISSSPPV